MPEIQELEDGIRRWFSRLPQHVICDACGHKVQLTSVEFRCVAHVKEDDRCHANLANLHRFPFNRGFLEDLLAQKCLAHVQPFRPFCGETHDLTIAFQMQRFPRVITFGAPDSGKTTYFVAVYHELHKDKSVVTMLLPAGKLQGFLADKYQPYLNQDRVGKTTQREPEAFSLGISPGPRRSWLPEPVAFSYTDAWGELMLEPERLLEELTSLEYASCIILILDPYRIPDLRRGLIHRLQARQTLTQELATALDECQSCEAAREDEDHWVERILNNAKERWGRGIRHGRKNSIPLALVLNKLEVFTQVFDEVNAFSCDSGLPDTGNADLWRWCHDVEQHARSLFEHLAGTVTPVASENPTLPKLVRDAEGTFRRVGCFAVSSTGPRSNVPPTPENVLAPLLWSMFQLRRSRWRPGA